MTLARQLNDLTRFDHLRLDSREFRLAVAARRNGMTNDLIWAARPLDGFPWMLGLASWLLAAAFAQASRFLLAHKPIRGGRQMTVMTVFGQSARQLLDLVFELFDLLFERQQFCHLGFESGVFFSQRLYFFFLCHSPTLPGFHCFGKSLAVPNSYDLGLALISHSAPWVKTKQQLRLLERTQRLILANTKLDGNFMLTMDAGPLFGLLTLFASLFELSRIKSTECSLVVDKIESSQYHFYHFVHFIFLAIFVPVHQGYIISEMSNLQFSSQQRHFIWRWIRRDIHLIELT